MEDFIWGRREGGRGEGKFYISSAVSDASTLVKLYNTVVGVKCVRLCFYVKFNSTGYIQKGGRGERGGVRLHQAKTNISIKMTFSEKRGVFSARLRLSNV